MCLKTQLTHLKDWLSAFSQNTQPVRFHKRLESLVTGSPIWWLRLWLEEYRLEKCLEKSGEQSFATKRQHERWRNVDMAYRYGRMPSPALKRAIDRCHQTGMSQQDIRLLIVNRILRADGSFRISPTKEIILYVLGWVFVAICVVQFVQTAVFIWASPADPFLKSLTTMVCLVVFLVCGYVVSCYNIIPFPVIKSLLRGNLDAARASG